MRVAGSAEQRARWRAHYWANREKIRTQQRAYERLPQCRKYRAAYRLRRKRANPAPWNLKLQRWRARNPERVRAWANDYYRRNADRLRAYQRDWRKGILPWQQWAELDAGMSWDCDGCGRMKTRSPTGRCRRCRTATCRRCSRPFLQQFVGQRIHTRCAGQE